MTAHDEEVARRAQAAMEHARLRIEEEAITFLLVGLEVESVSELRRLVEIARSAEMLEAAYTLALVGLPLT